jgi:hypothetical protein
MFNAHFSEKNRITSDSIEDGTDKQFLHISLNYRAVRQCQPKSVAFQRNRLFDPKERHDILHFKVKEGLVEVAGLAERIANFGPTRRGVSQPISIPFSELWAAARLGTVSLD